ncbi:MAG: hypothetical protein U1E65_03440 [Myxococcota bacterium]
MHAFLLAMLVAQPPELGSIRFERSWAVAAERARVESKPILILFDEVPGCATVLGFGRSVLADPEIVRLVEANFIPLAIFNNIASGPDRQILEEFGEPAWNNPVVRIVDRDRRERAPRFAGPYNKPAFAAILGRFGAAVVRLSGPCFWACEVKLGALEAVRATRAGFIDGNEVVEAELAPGEDAARFLESARRLGCADKVFDDAAASRFRPSARDTKYYLARSAYRELHLDETTQCRVNAALGRGEDPTRFLPKGAPSQAPPATEGEGCAAPK